MKKRVFKTITAAAMISLAVNSNAQGIMAGGAGHSIYSCNGTSSPSTVGDNSKGQLGDGTNTNKTTPVSVSGLSNVVWVSGANHSLFVKADGTVWSSGQDWSGELGNGLNNITVNAPVQVVGLTGIIKASAGGSHSLFLKSDGTVWACGNNNYGQLGDSTTTEQHVPVQVKGISNVVAVAAATYHSLFLKSDGTVWSCGYNLYGQLGHPSQAAPTSPSPYVHKIDTLSGIVAIAASAQHSLFVKNDGTIWACGRNYIGSLGDTLAGGVIPYKSRFLSGVTDVATGMYHSVFLKNDGTVWGAGQNANGQLASGAYDTLLVPVQIPSLSNITSIACGDFHSMFAKNDGTIWVTGSNGYGQLGDGTTAKRNTPEQVTGACSQASIEQYNNNNSFKIYPNPTNSSINVEVVGNNMQAEEIKIYDMLGKEISRSKEYTIDVRNLENGVYFIKVGNSTQKFIKQ